MSASGKFRVFAGQRSDPFFFNLGGFSSAVATAEGACGGACPGTLPKDAAGCLLIPGTTAAGLRTLVASPAAANNPAMCPAGVTDCFATLNVMAIVIQVDKTEVVNGMDKLVSVWGSTHAGS